MKNTYIENFKSFILDVAVILFSSIFFFIAIVALFKIFGYFVVNTLLIGFALLITWSAIGYYVDEQYNNMERQTDTESDDTFAVPLKCYSVTFLCKDNGKEETIGVMTTNGVNAILSGRKSLFEGKHLSNLRFVDIEEVDAI